MRIFRLKFRSPKKERKWLAWLLVSAPPNAESYYTVCCVLRSYIGSPSQGVPRQKQKTHEVTISHVYYSNPFMLWRTGRYWRRKTMVAKPCGYRKQAAATAVMQVSECVSITLNHLSEPIHIISVYRPPRINKKDKCKQFFEEFKKLLDSLPQNSKVIFCGDLNINLLLQNNKDVITYENLLAEYGFTKCINKITRSEILADTLVESCLDHIYVRAPLAGINSAVIQHKISDHYLISVAVDWKQSQTVGIKSAGTPTHPSPEITASSQRRRVLDNRAVRDKLLSVNFDELMSITCPLELYEAFRMIFKNIYDSCYVTRSYSHSNRDNKPWISNNLKNMILERDRLFIVWSNDPKNMVKRLNYTKFRNKCHKLIFKSRNKYDMQCILDCNNNIKKLWDRINILLGKDKQCLDRVILGYMGINETTKNICNKFSCTFSEEIECIKHICDIKLLDRTTYTTNLNMSMRWQPVDSQYVMRVIKQMDKNKSPGSDLIRMSDLKVLVDKAFDTLETDTLLNAMDECGVREPLNSWFRDYLTSRSYRVKVGEEFSDARGVTCGVPQGSGCGPVCYLMHVNSLCGVLRHCSAHMFADDLCALRAGTDLAETCRLVQEDVNSVVKWSHDNGIVLNADKTKLLIIHSPYLRLSETNPNIYTHSFDCIHNNYINCNCKPIERINCITYLGVKIDNNFSWSSHVDFICNKLRSLLGRFYHLSFKVPLSTLKCLYLSLVDSILSYSLDCYGLTFKTNIQKLESIQIRFLKMLVNKKTKDSCKGDYNKLFKICKILPISLKHKYLILLNNHSRRENLKLVAHEHCTKSVSVGKYEVPRVNNYFGDRMLDKRIPYLLNTLPTDIRQETNKNRYLVSTVQSISAPQFTFSKSQFKASTVPVLSKYNTKHRFT
ncbi:reverse transcriptase (RNA-dependent DNA polymerase) domain-containing protein [Phthorimaea operculella]|nr:reverse transcriptase (RNA-dependent DNA polymerase) domain-containing protein [Phthorimaea operculella]